MTNESATTSNNNDKITPITVFTGFLGAGKTTIILELLKQVPEGYKIVLLKNEFGDNAVDSLLGKDKNIDVQEIINGCLCCTLVGRMKEAIEEIKAQYSPDHILIETSGSAFPGPIAWQIRQMEKDSFRLDSIITVIDCENFQGYADTSYTAKLQAKYTDLILLNKHELVDERKLEDVIDHVNELNLDTPKIKYHRGELLDLNLFFGVDTKLFALTANKDEGVGVGDNNKMDMDHHDREVDLIQIAVASWGEPAKDKKMEPKAAPTQQEFLDFLQTLPTDTFFRVKGFVQFPSSSSSSSSSSTENGEEAADNFGYRLVNHAFGRTTLHPISRRLLPNNDVVRLTFMGVGFREQKWIRHITQFFQIDPISPEFQLHDRRSH